MPITAAEVQYRLSGGAANSNTNASIGGAKSSVEWIGVLFDDVSSAEATAGMVDYRCYYIHNANATLTMIGPKVWIKTNTPSTSTTVDIALGSSAQGATEQTIANETTAPTGVTFSAPSTFAAGIALGDIPAGGHRAIWIRRTVTAGAAGASDGYTLSIQADTNP